MATIDQNPELHSDPNPEGLREFVIARIFDFPRDLVFSAWTEERHLKNWFAPRGFTIPVCRLNLVPGGVFHYCMRAPNGAEMWGKWTFEEIVPPQRIVLVSTFSNKHGNPTRHPYVPNWPVEVLTRTTLIEDEDKTLVKLAWIPVNASRMECLTFSGMHEAMAQGWNGTLDQLAEYLATL